MKKFWLKKNFPFLSKNIGIDSIGGIVSLGIVTALLCSHTIAQTKIDSIKSGQAIKESLSTIHTPLVEPLIDTLIDALIDTVPKKETATLAATNSTSPKDQTQSISHQKPENTSIQNRKNPDSSVGNPKSDKAVDTEIKSAINNTRPKIQWAPTIGKIFWSGVIFTLAWLVLRFFSQLLNAIAERWSGQRLMIKGFVPILRISTWTFVIFIIISGVFQPPLNSLLAFTASAGLALGFASQDILKNIFGGIMILFDRPFQVGDKIEVGDHYGEVLQIGLRSVRMVTADDSIVTVPNGDIISRSVSNSNSGENNCQVVAECYLPVTIDIPHAKRIAYQAAVSSRYAYLSKPVAVIVKNEIHQGVSVLKFRIKAYVLDLRYEFAFMSEMTELFLTELKKEGLIKGTESLFASQSDSNTIQEQKD